MPSFLRQFQTLPVGKAMSVHCNIVPRAFTDAIAEVGRALRVEGEPTSAETI